MKKSLIIIAVLIAVVVGFLALYPLIEIDTGEKLIICNFDGDFSDYDKNHSYNEVYCYDEKHDVSIHSFTVKNFLFFYTVSMEYINGDFRKTQFVLNEDYIKDFIKNAEITDNENNISVADLIKGKTAIVGNTRYLGNDYSNGIFYKLGGKHEEMYIFYVDGLTIIQVGSPDELPKYIAYK